MHRVSFDISVDVSRTDAFVFASSKFITDTLGSYYGKKIPPVVPLHISGGKQDVYLGCLSHRPHNLQPFKLLISITLGEDLGLVDGDIVQCTPVYNPLKAAKVLVLPASVDDSEVVEQNAFRIEAQLLRQVQVVFLGMTLTVAVFPGVHAKVVVQRIEDVCGTEVIHGCAMMFEGTDFVIATRARQMEATGMVPMWCVLRFCGVPKSFDVKKAASLFINPATAARYHLKEGLVVGFFDLARMSQLLDSRQITPSFLRSNAWKAPIQLSEEVPVDVCSCAVLGQASNIVLFPSPDEHIPAITDSLPSPDDCFPFRRRDLCYEDVVAVHGDAPCELMRHLSSWFLRGGLSFTSFERCVKRGNGNVLFCGEKGHGKSSVVSAVLSELRDIHVCLVPCGQEKGVLLMLQKALFECVMCAPSVLVLENFDAIASRQSEGSSTASISNGTKSILEDVLCSFTNIPTLGCVGSSLVVIATCERRDNLHESLRSVICFPKVIKMESLNRKRRVALLKQIFPIAPVEVTEQLVSLMDNYTPFDITRVSERIRSRLKGSGKVSLVEAAREAIVFFTPLSHAGVKFLQGGMMVSLDSVGGLSAAKKALYDTLVLPIRHPEVFGRLPLKTRSGILLYGPSGCGKTFVVEAVVNTENLKCIVVNGPEVFGKYIGQSEEKIRDVFERAQAAAPCVIFFDEFDSVAPQRGADNSGVTDRVVNQLLCYLDGVEGRKDVYIVAASSRPDLIDAALLRPGRLDRAVQCPIPSQEERVDILTKCLKIASVKGLTQFEVEAIAKETVDWTPADLSGLVSCAALAFSRRVVDERERRLRLAETGGGALPDFVLVNVGTGKGEASRDHTEDALRSALGVVVRKEDICEEENAKKEEVDAMSISMEDIRCALAKMRPSLGSKEITRQERIHRQFLHGSMDAELVGKKLALQ